ncbi:outer membrane beta-barrel protein [Acinetobacter sp. YIM 103518]|uniref:Outer membrane beta-barrel protein n=1 Tax=Acinetobacter faecalis TaxID=2665161 RepID=A0A6L6GEN4_9GAMM|nr:outer membrane protein transport protein [Acinetobacter faecalis]MDY6510556.1 outer membrane protein transport protein [Acinetobacter faecalis]MTD10896.1 outer membrane beta-barrel protein [Acinetobacter faecalis]
MKLKTLSVAMILATAPMTGAFAAAMDRTGQSISAFLQPGNYAEAGLSVLDADVSGKDKNGVNTGDMAASYHSASAALKIQATDNISVGLLFDQPFGAKAEYDSSSPAFSQNLGTSIQTTSAEVTTENLTLLVGYQPNANLNFYAGPVWQQAKGEVHLRGTAYASLNGYDANMKNDDAWGWAAGAAYQIPEIALKASLTYRSEIKHKLDSGESVQQYNATAAGMLAALPSGITEVTTPQSVNLDFQTGIMANTVAFANVRWVNWDGFAIKPPKFGTLTAGAGLPNANLVEYNKDQWTINAGVGRKLTEKWSGTVSVGWDSGAGNPVTTLGPTEGYWSLGLGAQFSPAENYFIQGGVKYFWLGDADALTASSPYEGSFKDNHAIGYGMKIGYKF